MTIDAAIDKVTREIDVQLEQALDDYAFKMIACDVDPELMEDILAEQRARNAVWRLVTLDAIRAELMAF